VHHILKICRRGKTHFCDAPIKIQNQNLNNNLQINIFAKAQTTKDEDKATAQKRNSTISKDSPLTALVILVENTHRQISAANFKIFSNLK